jgi:RNA polymerase sigma factor (sigma-70 family)
MSCEETLILLDAYFDNELDLAKAIAIEEHLCACSSCPFEYEQRVALRSRLEDPDLRHHAPAMLPFMSEAYNLARWIMKDESDARDATQDAYVKAFRYSESFHGDSGRAWLLQIVRNVCYDALRARDSHCNITSLNEEMVAAVADPKPALNVIAIREATKFRVREAVEALPLEFRTVIILRELEGFSYKEISGITGVPIGRVMSRLSRARQQLATLLQEEGENE